MEQHNFQLFGKYLLLDRVASGGMAAVYLARPATSTGNGRVLVVKRILPQVADDPAFLEMFKTETRICMGFNHPNIVQIFDFGQVDTQPYIAMEYVEGRNLRELAGQFARKQMTMPVGVAVSVVTRAAAALHYAHNFQNRVTGEQLHLVHRDVSPQNILVSFEGNVKVIDFGVAKTNLEGSQQTRAGSIKGKISYLSPEQIRSEQLDGRSDLFSLGIVLWEMLTGRKLFNPAQKNDYQILEAISNCDKTVRPPSTLNPLVPAELDEIVMRALRPAKGERWQNCEAFENALRGFLMTSMPGFQYKDVGEAARGVFVDEMMQGREKLRRLNEHAQKLLEEAPPAGGEGGTVALGTFHGNVQSHIPPPLPPRPAAATPLAGAAASGVASAQAAPTPAYASAIPQPPLPAGMSPIAPPSPMPMPTPTGMRNVYDRSNLTSFNPPATGFIVLGNYTGVAATPAAAEKPWFAKVTRLRLLSVILYVLTIYFLRMDREYMFFERFFVPADVIRMASTAPPAPMAMPMRTRRSPALQAAMALTRPAPPANAPIDPRSEALDPRDDDPNAPDDGGAESVANADDRGGDYAQDESDVQEGAVEEVRAPLRRRPAAARAPQAVWLQISVTPRQDPRNTRIYVNDTLLKPREDQVSIPVDHRVVVRVERNAFWPYQNQFTISSAKLRGAHTFRLDVRLRKSNR